MSTTVHKTLQKAWLIAGCCWWNEW